MKKTIAGILPIFIFCAISQAQGKTDIQEYIEQIACSAPMATAQLGVRAMRMDGSVIADYCGDCMMVPASNAKLITTGAVLAALGPDARMETVLAYSGSVEDGILKGDLYIVGGADPTLASGDAVAPSAANLFAGWRRALAKAGISAIEGDVVGDGRWFDGPIEHPSWLYEDIGTYYGAGCDALCYYRNIQEFRVVPGAKAGDPLRQAVPSNPVLPWMSFSYDCRTGAAGTGDRLYLFATDLYPVARLRGTFAQDRQSKTVQCSNKFGAYTMAWMFRENLVASGVRVLGKAADISHSGLIRTDLSSEGQRKAADVSSLTSIHVQKSPTLFQIACLTNQRSDNFYAETLFRYLSKVKRGSADYSVCHLALEDIVRSLGVSTSGRIQICDGSGLSRKDAVSPSFFCDFLKAMLESDAREAFAGTLSQPGVGPQTGRMRAEDPACTARIYYKSGSMDGVRCYSGYVVPRDGGKEDVIVFSIMVNNYDSALQWKVMGQIDRMMALIAREN